MDISIVVKVFGWITAINYGILTIWFLTFVFAKNWYYQLTSNWFSIPKDKFDMIHYTLMGTFELLVFILFLAPYLAFKIVL